MATIKKNLTSRSREREREVNLKDYINNKAIELKKRFEDGIIIKNNYIALLELLQNCKTKEQVDLVFQWGSENPQTGYYFKRQVENFRESARYLKKVDTINPNNEKNIKNKLIIGDNYDALNNLIAGGYKGKIDVIYIDPPYGMDNEGEFAKTNYENKVTRDELLSMLEPRLELAKQLLSSEGCIFCSIDDRNHAYVKMLFDRVFSENNFIASLVWHARRGGGNDTKFIAVDHEYILVYSKNKNLCELKGVEKESDSFKFSDKHVEKRGKYNLQQFDRASLTYTKSLDYPIECPDGTFIYPGHVTKEEFENRQLNKIKRNDWCWMMSKETFKKALKDDFIVFQKNNKNSVWNVRVKTYEKINYKGKNTQRLIKLRSILRECSTQDGRKDLLDLGINTFDYPKPVELITNLIKYFNNKNLTFLDFFAGSGTSGQAILNLNKIDSGNRKWILCTNNDKDDKNPNGIAYDTTIIRLKKCINKYFQNSSFSVYEIKEATVRTDENCLLDKINEEDYDLPKFKTELAKIEWICDNFKVCTKKLVKEE